jgi:DNA-binding NarL/FixJ family response regulator
MFGSQRGVVSESTLRKGTVMTVQALPRTALAAPRVFALHSLPLTRNHLRRLVSTAEDLTWLGAMDSLRMAAPIITGLQPDVVVLQSSLDPDASFARHLASEFPSVVLVVLAEDTVRARVHSRALRGCARHAVMAPSAPPASLLAAMRRAGTEEPVAVPALAAPLSARQREVLALIASGHETVAISRELSISTETVRTHVKEILRRLEAHDRAHAVAIGYRTGLLGEGA